MTHHPEIPAPIHAARLIRQHVSPSAIRAVRAACGRVALEEAILAVVRGACPVGVAAGLADLAASAGGAK